MTTRQFTQVALGAVLLVLLGGLALPALGGDREVSPADGPVAPAPAIPAGAEVLDGVGFDGEVDDLPALVRSAEDAGLAPEQIAALSDGRVTFAEYQALMSSGRDCAHRDGVDLVLLPPRQDPNTTVTRIELAIPADDARQPTIDRVVADCLTRHVTPAEGVYVRAHMPPRDELQARQDAEFERYYACLVGAGIQLPAFDQLTIDHLLAYLDSVPACRPPLQL